MLTNEEMVSESSSRPWTAGLRVETVGQMAASLLWIASVFAYGVSTVGDVLQLAAASAWMVANVDAIRRARQAVED